MNVKSIAYIYNRALWLKTVVIQDHIFSLLKRHFIPDLRMLLKSKTKIRMLFIVLKRRYFSDYKDEQVHIHLHRRALELIHFVEILFVYEGYRLFLIVIEVPNLSHS